MVTVFLVVCVLAAQGTPPHRPRLPQRADTNDWEAYFDRGVEVMRRFPNKADTLFYWASRLDPSRPEPLYARWVAFWMADVPGFERYLEQDPRILELPRVRSADSLYLRALQRNPFVAQTLLILAYDQLPGEWRGGAATLGWMAYSKLQFSRAASYFAQLTRADPDKHLWVRYYRALTFVPVGAYDSAQVEMAALLASLQARANTQTLHEYQSLEMINYGIGLLHLVQGHTDSARRYFEQAVEENLAFFPAHMQLGELALARINRAVAEQDFRQAAELAPDEAWIHHRYGAALLRMGRAADALVPLQRAVTLEPWYAEPYRMLGIAWSAAGDNDAAAKALEQYLQRAPRRETDAITDAQRRLAILRGSGR